MLPKLFWPTGKNCSSDRGKRLKFEAECQEFAKFLRSLEQFIQTVAISALKVFIASLGVPVSFLINDITN